MTAPVTCYACSGDTFIPVDTWDGEEVVILYATCTRCWGSGVLTDSPSLTDVAWSLRPVWRDVPCLCYYPVDGPEGHPECPAR